MLFTNKTIFFRNFEDAKEFVDTIGGFISVMTDFEKKYYGKDYVENKTKVLLRTTNDFMESLKDFGIKRVKRNGHVVYEKES